MTWSFTISQATPSLNRIHGNHWSANKKAKSAIAWLLAAALNGIPPIPKATGRRRLVIVRYGRGRLDRANLVGGAKWLEDAIKDRGLLLDDDDAGCDLIVSQIVFRKGIPHTVVTLQDLEEAS